MNSCEFDLWFDYSIQTVQAPFWKQIWKMSPNFLSKHHLSLCTCLPYEVQYIWVLSIKDSFKFRLDWSLTYMYVHVDRHISRSESTLYTCWLDKGSYMYRVSQKKGNPVCQRDIFIATQFLIKLQSTLPKSNILGLKK